MIYYKNIVTPIIIVGIVLVVTITIPIIIIQFDANRCVARRFGNNDPMCGDGTPVRGRYCGYNECSILGYKCVCRNPLNSMIPFEAGDIIACYINPDYHLMLALDNTKIIHPTDIENNRTIIRLESFQDLLKRKQYNHCQVITDFMNRVLLEYYKVEPRYNTDAIIARSAINKTIYYDKTRWNCEHIVTNWKYNSQYGFNIQQFNENSMRRP